MIHDTPTHSVPHTDDDRSPTGSSRQVQLKSEFIIWTVRSPLRVTRPTAKSSCPSSCPVVALNPAIQPVHPAPHIDEPRGSSKVSGTLLSRYPRTVYSFNSVPLPNTPMIPCKPLQQLHDLNRASPQFHDQLSNFLRGNEYRNGFPNLQSEDSAWLVEYLDSVSLRTTFIHPALRTGTGSRWYFRSCKSHIPGIPTRTRKYMQHQGVATEILCTLRLSSGPQLSVCFWMRV